MRIGVAGCTGRVGQLIVNELEMGNWNGLSISCGLSRTIPEKSFDFLVTQDPKLLFKNCDCVIDFTLPESSIENAKYAADFKKPIVIGTTGLSAEQEKQLETYGQDTAIIYAPNMSVGVTTLMALVEDAARKLDEAWDIEIFESHHIKKIDAPSGTAIGLGRAAAKGRDRELPSKIECNRNGERENGSIGFSVARGGDVIGEHTVFFFGQGERLELTHRATNRALFAKGSLKAASWINNRAPGLYSMRDVLGI